MIKRYTLPAVTREGRATSIGVSIDSLKLHEWLSCARRRQAIDCFDFSWSKNPHAISFHLLGDFWTVYKSGGIYVEVNLHLGQYYRNATYTLDEFCSMFRFTERPSTLSLCVTVKV